MKYKIKKHAMLFTVALAMVGGFVLFLRPEQAFAITFPGSNVFPHTPKSKPAIPVGCPGSNKAGPPAPASNGKGSICDTIPGGCPGSSHVGNHRPASQCKYAAPAGWNGSSSKGGSGGGSSDSGSSSNGSSGGSSGSGGSGQGGSGSNNGGQNGGSGGGSPTGGQQSAPTAQTVPTVKFNQGIHNTTRDVCGGTVNGQDESVAVAIKIGCKGKGNPIADATFAIIRILSDGVGLVVIGSIIVGGIQYSGSRGDPQATALAVGRIRSSLFALVIFIFGYAILNFIIPAGFLG